MKWHVWIAWIMTLMVNAVRVVQGRGHGSTVKLSYILVTIK